MDGKTPVQRICPYRQAVGGVCLNFALGLSCSLYPGDNICMIEAQVRNPEWMSEKTRNRLDAAKRIDTKGTAACVFLKA